MLIIITIIIINNTSNNSTDVTIIKSSRKYISNVPEKHEMKEMEKTPILCTAHTQTHTHTHTHFRKY